MEGYYRGESRRYARIRPTLVREEIGPVALATESRYYRESIAALAETLHIQSYDVDGAGEREHVKALATLQHYGFRTRLIDVTRNYDVALYFAAADYFDADGYVHIIPRDAGFIPVQNEWAYSVKRKIHLLFAGADLLASSADLGAYFANRDKLPAGYIQKWTLSDPVILDYEKVFGIKEAINIRYQRQEAGFILLGNNVESKDGKLVLGAEINYGALDRLESRIVPAAEKLPALYRLSRQSPAINFARLFPDATKSIELARVHRDIYMLAGGEERRMELFNRCLRRAFDLTEADDGFSKELERRLPELFKQLENEDIFYFVCCELAAFFRYFSDREAHLPKVLEILDDLCR
ncbi:MAG TPA: FRG domain-containing protein [Acholeplasmataceae bacterium]|nr:FRG domain-containing protein [Acholeplasmataceae bacterium]